MTLLKFSLKIIKDITILNFCNNLEGYANPKRLYKPRYVLCNEITHISSCDL